MNVTAAEQAGAAILEVLVEQRATVRARDTVGDIEGGIGQSRSIVASINRRAVANGLTLYGVIGLSFVAVIYLRIK